jgi:hypothetical protein
VRAVYHARRYWIGIVAAVACFVAAAHVPPLATYALTMTAIGLVLDAATAWWGKNARRGGMHDYRQ